MNALPFVVSVLLVLLSGLFAALGTAYGRVSRSSMETQRREGSVKAARLERMLDDRARYINALQLAEITATTAAVTSTTAGYLTLIDDQLMALLAAAGTMVVISFVVLGVAPQTLGRQHPERFALGGVPLVRFVALLFAPFARLMILIGNMITPGKGFQEGPFANQAELRELVDLAGQGSVIEDDERQMIHSVFDLGDTIAREVMVPRTEMVWIERGKTLRQAISLALRSGYSRIPVIGEDLDDIVGVVYLKDLTRRVFEHQDAQNSERVEDHMRSPYLVPDTKGVDELLKDMQTARVHIAILVDEYGGTAGLATIEDILEEIVGDITDEYDIEGPEVEELTGGRYRVSARMHVEDFAELIGWEYEDEGVDTIAGLMAKRLGVVPIPGAQLNIEHWTITAERAAGRRNQVGTLLVEPAAEF